MKDRVPLYPGRVTLTPVSGQANTYDMVRADQPTEEGTPLNKENLLSDETAAALGLSGDPTVDDAFGALAGSIKLSEVEATLPSSASWESVTYGDGKFVAVASGSTKAAYSTNGINWTAATLPSSESWEAVTYGDGKFVAVAYNTTNKAAYSTNGINWTAATLPISGNWRSVTYGNGKFVAVAYNGTKAAYSTNGINWTAATLPSSAYWYSVTYGNGKFVAVANGRTNEAAYSTDGINWTAATLPSSAGWSSVTYGNGKFVAVASGRTNEAAYSTDGINWTAATLPSSAYWYSVTYGNGKFVAVASTTKAAYSTNGINWTAATLPSSAGWRSVTYGDGKFVAVASGSTKAAYSTDGINWSDSAQLLVDSAGDDITDDVAQALGVSKIVTGSYTGTETYGSSRRNSLTFDSQPKLVIVSCSYNYYYGGFPWLYGVTQGRSHQSNSSSYVTISWSGNTVSWYSTGSSANQLNSGNDVYYYFAIL